LVYISIKNDLKSLNNDLILRVRKGKCGEIQIYEMLKAVKILNTTNAGQSYLLDHRGDENFNDLLDMLKNMTSDMRNGKMNITDITTKYMEKIPQI
jgi:hypothetical protein